MDHAMETGSPAVGPLTPRVSVIVPLFNEEENLPELHRRLTAVLGDYGESYELLFVNDGSRDSTPLLLDELAGQDAHVAAVHLSRNFGHQAAICAGLDLARGQAVLIMDGDLQDPPEVLPQFLDKWREGNDVVYAVRAKRKENLFKRTAYFLFYRILGKVSDLAIPLDSGDFCLMDRKVVDALRGMPEKTRFVRGLRAFVGFKQVGLVYDRQARQAGPPKYTLRALFKLAMDGLISFSSFPLNLVTYLGLGAVLVAMGLTGWVLYTALVTQSGPHGWASLAVLVLFLNAIQLLSLGILGEYVRRIFLEVKERPTYILGRVKRQSEAPTQTADETRKAA